MSRIALVCTIHEELGAANVVELHRMLVDIQPQVIFVEVPPAAFDDVFVTGTRANLESRAMNRYQKQQTVQIVPVDLPTPDRTFFEDYDQLCSVIRSRSPLFRQLMTQDCHRIWTYGFAYLNSDYCSQHWSDTYAEMQNVIDQTGDAGWARVFDDFREKNAMRDAAMVEAIRSSCRIHTPDRSAFLVGAAHRQSIIDRFQDSAVRADVHLKWDYTGSAIWSSAEPSGA